MSLLMEALKKAEEAKRHTDQPVTRPVRNRTPAAAQPTAERPWMGITVNSASTIQPTTRTAVSSHRLPLNASRAGIAPTTRVANWGAVRPKNRPTLSRE